MVEFDKWWEEVNIPHVPTHMDTATSVEAWRGAFTNMQQWLMGRRCTGEDVLDYVNKELSGVT